VVYISRELNPRGEQRGILGAVRETVWLVVEGKRPEYLPSHLLGEMGEEPFH
jgi:hypothetical protein